jgi:hypothetical protein
VCGNDCLSLAQVFRRYKDFVNGRKTAGVEPRSGRPASVRTSTNVDRVRAFIGLDLRLNIRMIADSVTRHDKFAALSVSHYTDVILKGIMLI